jgi:hypothetical protein
VALIKRCRADGRRSSIPKRVAALRGEYVDEILEIVQAHIGAASISGGIHPKLAPSIRQWLQGRRPADAPAEIAADICPDCKQLLSEPARPMLHHNGVPVWCAYCEDSRPYKQTEITQAIEPEIDASHSECGA